MKFLTKFLISIWLFVLCTNPVYASERCRLSVDDLASAQSIVEWGRYNYSLTRNSAFILAWDRFGYDALDAEFDRYREIGGGQWGNMRSWKGCLRSYSQDITICGLKTSETNEKRFEKGKALKGLPETPPDAAIALATSMIGDCFGQKSVGLPIAPTLPFATVFEMDGFAEGPFPPLKCDYAAHRAEATKDEYDARKQLHIWHRWSWARDYERHEQAQGRSCINMPRFIADEIATNDPKWVSFQKEISAAKAAQKAREQEAVRVAERNASLAELRAFGEQQRARLSEATLYADLGPLPRDAGTVREFDPADPRFQSILRDLDRFERIYTPTDLTELQIAAADGCARCANLLSNAYENGLFGQAPNLKRAAQYAVLAYGLSARPWDGLISWGDGNFAKASRLIKEIPEPYLGDMAPIRRAIERADNDDASNSRARLAGISHAMFETVPIRAKTRAARPLNAQTITREQIQTIRGVRGIHQLADQLLSAIPSSRPLTPAQESLLWSATETGHYGSALAIARRAANRGATRVAVYHFDAAAAMAPNDPAPVLEKAQMLYTQGDYEAAGEAAIKVAALGNLEGTTLYNQSQAKLRDMAAAQRRAMAEKRRARQADQGTPYTLSDGFRDLGNAIQQDTADYLDCLDRAERTGGYCVRRR